MFRKFFLAASLMLFSLFAVPVAHAQNEATINGYDGINIYWNNNTGVLKTPTGAIPFSGAPTGPCINGQTAVNTITGAYSLCVNFQWGTANVVTAGVVTNGINISVNGQFNPKNYGALGGATASRNVVYTQNSSTVTSADSPCPWTAASIGQRFQGSANAISEFGTSTGGSTTNEVVVNSFGPGCKITLNTPVNNGASGTGYGVTYPQPAATETAAFCCGASSANAAAGGGASVANAFNPGYSSPTLAYTGTVFVQNDGYAVSGGIFQSRASANNGQGVSFIGNYPIFYVVPSFVPFNTATEPGALMESVLVNNYEIGKFYVNGMNFLNTNLGSGQGFLAYNNGSYFVVHDIIANDIGTSAGGNAAIFKFQTDTFARAEGINAQNAPGGSAEVACLFNGVGLFEVYSSFCSNHFINLLVLNSGLRTGNSGDLTFYGFHDDECGTNGVGCAQFQNSLVTFDGCLLFNPGNIASLDLDTTSIGHLHNCNVSAFNTDAGNANAIVGHGNAQLFLDHTDVAGNNTGTCFNGVSTFLVFDVGGNLCWNQVGGVRTKATIAQTYSGGMLSPVFPLLPGSMTQLGGSQQVNGNAPTSPSITRNGTSTVAFDSGSTDAYWTITVTAAGTTTAVGAVSFTLGRAAVHQETCSANYQNGTGTWAIGAIPPIFTTLNTTTVTFNINNAGTNLTATSTYKITGTCAGI